jgi:uncharacterized lipoprotein YbaY
LFGTIIGFLLGKIGKIDDGFFWLQKKHRILSLGDLGLLRVQLVDWNSTDRKIGNTQRNTATRHKMSAFEFQLQFNPQTILPNFS